MSEGAPIAVVEHGDGAVLYDLPFAASSLPPVFSRDLQAAWDATCTAAIRPGPARLFRFAGGPAMSLSDRDARRWAAAVDRVTGLHTAYGVALLLRLLSLVDLLARAPWLREAGLSGTSLTSGSLAVTAGRRRSRTAEPSPALLRAAAACRMTGEARLDETRLRQALAPTGVAA